MHERLKILNFTKRIFSSVTFPETDFSFFLLFLLYHHLLDMCSKFTFLTAADSGVKKRGGVWSETGGGDRNFLAHGGYKKAARNCYTCGSPDHLMRDCPLAFNLHLFQPGNGTFHGGVPGYPPPYWNGSMLPFRPYANMYGNPSAMPFNLSMVPVIPFAVPSYIPSMGVGLHGPGGNMGIEGMGPVGNRVESSPYSNLELQHFEPRKKHSNEDLGREKLRDEEDSHDCCRDNKPDKSHQYKSQKEKKHSLNQSEDSFTRRSKRKNQHDKYMDSDILYLDERLEKKSRSSHASRDKKLHHSERSSSGIEDMSRSSERYSERRRKDHHGESKHHKRGLCIDRRRECKERDSGHDSRHSFAKHSRHEQHDDKWHMISGSNDSKDEYRHHKRKRVY
ncbi:E3 ubiquitin ligase PARAQUAT TOLERANCE 3-like isoform X1 [Olea europaea subsp. europaea]|uniref:E3 ubiquitin ligase PARAQUAT TOLERANCE 3-like isoform X1 n=1 Tax=Olea europaea subsp. europaea TaxID=158383 RepID=A0A8S0Q5X8_OLEEU|nr:E3 ubiquitin ligase PARAQUAT TOLERANCE 3-like isoform X1 [Olea europaea subsp. europaea]